VALGALVIVALATAGMGRAGVNTIIVANQDDAGPGSLRQALLDAGSGDTIVVPKGTYTLTSGFLTVDTHLTIDGAGARKTIIDGDREDRVFKVDGGPVLFRDLTITRGDAADEFAGGGGLLITGGIDVTLQKVAVVRNRATTTGGGTPGGGGIATNGTLLVERSTVARNTLVGGTGGGIDYISGTEEITVSNSTVTKNTAPGGAGINSGSAITIEWSTVVGNEGTADIRGVGGEGAPATLSNSILGSCASGIDNYVSGGHNVQSGNTCPADGPGDLTDQALRLQDFGDYGGPTDTLLPKATSPAINHGDKACPPPAKDQRGVPRPQGRRCDSGADEREKN
jgi:hypothetical protein